MVKHPFLEGLARRVLVCDGAMGTALLGHGIEFDQSFDAICVSSPDLVRSIHSQYIKAGADVIQTNSFGANALRLGAFGLAAQCRTINQTAALLARQAKQESGRNVFVAGSIGPTGSAFSGHGRVTPDQMRDAFGRQVEGLLDGEVDLFVLETFSDLEEIGLAIEAVRLQSALPIVAQLTFREDGLTAREVSPEECVEYLTARPVDVVGANCSAGPQLMLPVLKRMTAKATRPLSAMPSASLPRQIEGRLVYETSPEQFAEVAQEFLTLGVRLIGGCCGTTPEYIRRLAEITSGDRSNAT